MEKPRNVIILCAGDSITEQGYPPFLGGLLRRSGLRARILNYGRRGNTSAEYLDFLKTDVRKIDAERPDFVLIELGTNDVRLDGDRVSQDAFEKNLGEITTILGGLQTRTGGRPDLFLATVPPIPAGIPFPFGAESSRRVIEEINPAIRKIAAGAGFVLVDNHALFLAAPDLLPGIHPSREGYKAMAGNWFRALESRLEARRSR